MIDKALDWLRKFEIGVWALLRRAIGLYNRCPCCGQVCGVVLSKKKFLFLAKRCDQCGLIYRVPTRIQPNLYGNRYHNAAIWHRDFKSGVLEKDAEENFRNTKWDYYDKLSLITAIKSSGRLLDYGGGSGIISSQLSELGFDVTLFEVCRKMRSISVDMLNINTCNNIGRVLEQYHHSYDIVFLHHVLEHIDNLCMAFSHFDQLLKQDGLLVIFVPNAGFSPKDPGASLDSAHCCAFDANFFKRNLPLFGLQGVTFSQPYAFDNSELGDRTRNAKGNELAIFAWRRICEAPCELKNWPFALPDLRHSSRAQEGC